MVLDLQDVNATLEDVNELVGDIEGEADSVSTDEDEVVRFSLRQLMSGVSPSPMTIE